MYIGGSPAAATGKDPPQAKRTPFERDRVECRRI